MQVRKHFYGFLREKSPLILCNKRQFNWLSFVCAFELNPLLKLNESPQNIVSHVYNFSLILAIDSSLARVTTTPDIALALIIVLVLEAHILGGCCNFFPSQTRTAATGAIRGDDRLLREWTRERVIHSFDNLSRRASSQHTPRLKHILSGCRSMSEKYIKSVCVCVWGAEKCFTSLFVVRFCSLMIHHIALSSAVQFSLCVIFPSLRWKRGKVGDATRFASAGKEENYLIRSVH